MAGILKINEKLKLSLVFSLSIKPVLIVVPDRDIPGINASAWERPMIRAFLVEFFWLFTSLVCFFDKSRKIVVIIRPMATMVNELKT